MWSILKGVTAVSDFLSAVTVPTVCLFERSAVLLHSVAVCDWRRCLQFWQCPSLFVHCSSGCGQQLSVSGMSSVAMYGTPGSMLICRLGLAAVSGRSLLVSVVGANLHDGDLGVMMDGPPGPLSKTMDSLMNSSRGQSVTHSGLCANVQLTGLFYL